MSLERASSLGNNAVKLGEQFLLTCVKSEYQSVERRTDLQFDIFNFLPLVDFLLLYPLGLISVVSEILSGAICHSVDVRFQLLYVVVRIV